MTPRGSGSTVLQKVIAALLAIVGSLFGWGVHQITKGIDTISSHVEALDRAMTAYILKSSNDITRLEEYEKLQDEELTEMRDRLDTAATEAGKPPKKHTR
jgi:hypothetical protein